MGKFVALFACLLAIPLAWLPQKQSPGKEILLLQEPRKVSGIVADSLGQPVAGAEIWHNDDRKDLVVTDLNGRFEFSTRAPAFVIRKNGYTGAFVRTETAQSVRVTLQQRSAAIPVCAAKMECNSIVGFGSAFCFPNVIGVRVSEQANDIDYGTRIYSVRLKSGWQVMQQAGGGEWSAGMPLDEDVWSSVEYSEKTYHFGRGSIVDARGKNSSGKYWRSIGRFGETATYRNVDQETSMVFDRVIDGVCIREEKRK
jgi:hypothetical protein